MEGVRQTVSEAQQKKMGSGGTKQLSHNMHFLSKSVLPRQHSPWLCGVQLHALDAVCPLQELALQHKKERSKSESNAGALQADTHTQAQQYRP